MEQQQQKYKLRDNQINKIMYFQDLKEQATETAFKRVRMLYLEDRNFTVVITNMFKELKEATLKELEEGMMIMSHLLENINEKQKL